MGTDNKNNKNNDVPTPATTIAEYILHLTSKSAEQELDMLKLLMNSLTWTAAAMSKQHDKYCPAAYMEGQWGHPREGDCVNNCAIDKTFKEQNIECWAMFLLDKGVEVGDIVSDNKKGEKGGK